MQTNKKDKPDILRNMAAHVALREAVRYLVTHRLGWNPQTLTECLLDEIAAKFPEAVRDAKGAMAKHEDLLAEQLFFGTMRLAGVEAAKRCGNVIQSKRGW
jgi:hypothetical protein